MSKTDTSLISPPLGLQADESLDSSGGTWAADVYSIEGFILHSGA